MGCDSFPAFLFFDMIVIAAIITAPPAIHCPTDNPVNESLNGWIKEELFMDFKIDHCKSREEFIAVIERYVE